MADAAYSSFYFDKYAGETDAPDKDDLCPGNPEEYLARLNDIECPRQRLITFYKSLLNFASPPTHEARFVQQCALVGTVSSAVIGGIFKSPDIHVEYQLKHNASVYTSTFQANRHFWDTLISGCARRGLRYGVRSFAFCTTASLIATSSTIYRNKPHFVDHVGGFAAFGALSRLWLGPRAVLVGGLIGSLVGTVIFGGLKAVELGTGMSLAQLRYIEQVRFSEARELKRRQRMEANEKYHMDNLEEIPR